MSKYCVLPGQEPVRLTSLGSHIVIIGEQLREIPEMFVSQARAAGCLSEEELEGLKLRLLAGMSQTSTITPAPAEGGLPTDPDPNSAPPPSNPAPSEAGGSPERAEQIKAAVIEVLNTANPTDLTNGGAPKVEVLSGKLGFEVTAAERDAACAAAKG